MKIPPALSRLPLALALGLGLASCSGSEPAGPETPPPPVAGSLTTVSGDQQSGTVGAALSAPLVVNVKATTGAAMAGQAVTWAVTSGGGTVSQGSVTSGSDGNASVTWTLGGSVGAQTVTATAAAFSVTFTATAGAGPVATVVVTPEQGTLEALDATVKLAAEVKDAFGNPATGSVTWSSSDTSVVKVDSTGTATAVGNGTAEVVATSGALSGKATLTVAQRVSALTLAPETPSVAVGGTTQLTATAKDANGFAVEGATVAWASLDTAVARVDTMGLVTGVADGATSVTATSGEASDTVGVTVTAAPFKPTEDTEITGTVNVGEVEIAEGVTVTLKGDAVLNATGNVTVAGTLVGDCVAAEIFAGGDLTITGTVRNECTDPAAAERIPDLVIRSPGGTLTLQGATLASAGAIIVGDTAETAAAAGPALGTQRTETIQSCVVSETNLGAGSAVLANEASVGEGSDVLVLCRGPMIVSGSEFRAGHGRAGMAREGTGTVTGEAGDRGGMVLVATAKKLHFSSIDGPTRIYAGNGGKGGAAVARGADARAEGGRGGPAGYFSVGIITSDVDVDPGAIEVHLGVGGAGGDAIAEGLDGLNATADAPAQPGDGVTAVGGLGGARPSVDFGNAEIHGSVVEGGGPGAGGNAFATSGDGGNGSEAHPEGARGGRGEATGGDAGGDPDRIGKWTFTSSVVARGGNATLAGGTGGLGATRCTMRGGDGGRGGSGEMRVGVGETPADNGQAFLNGFGNGGAGGTGLYAGSGGAAGDPGFGNAQPAVVKPSLQPGADGGLCPQDVTLGGVVIQVGDDPASHASFIGLGPSFLRVVLQALAGGTGVEGAWPAEGVGTVTVSGDGNWISVSGTLGEDGTFNLTGSGTAAGIQNVGTSFSGTVTRNADGAITGLSGTLTMGTGGELYGTPISYTVTASK